MSLHDVPGEQPSKLPGFTPIRYDPPKATTNRGLAGRPAALGETPVPVKVDGIPRPVAGPAPDQSTFRKIKIPVEERGTKATLEKMAEMTVEASRDPYFIEFSRGVVRDCPARDYECILRTIFSFVKKNVRYRNDPSFSEFISSPGWTLFVSGEEDCDGISMVIAAMLLAVGIPDVAFRAAWLDKANPREASHVWTIARPQGYADVVPLDAVAFGAPGQEPPRSEWVRPPLDWPIVG